MIISRRAAVIALAMTLPAAVHAQRGGGGGGRGMGPGPGVNSVGPIIDMRRELNLSSRQLVQLDSIERTLYNRNATLRNRQRARLDSLRPRGDMTSEQEMQWRRSEGDSLRALRRSLAQNDSVARIAAMNVLTDSQRVHVRERAAERRGFMAGRMSRDQRGMRRPPQQFDNGGPRGGGRMGMGGPGGGMGMGGPGARMRRGEFGPPDDTAGPYMRRRGMGTPDNVGPGDPGFAPRRRSMDSLDAPSGYYRPRFRRPPADSVL